MPVVVLTAPALRSADDLDAALRSVNTAVADALALPLEAVHSLFVAAVAGRTGDTSQAPWPVAVLHGRRRGDAPMRAATAQVAAVLGAHWQRPVDQVWVQWMATD